MPRRPSLEDRLRGWRRRLRALVHRRSADREMSAELSFQLEMETEHNIRSGMDPAAARRSALIAFGGRERVTEDVRDVRNVGWIEDLVADVRHAARAFRRTPGFTLAAVVALALGIGANTAVFAVVHGIVLAPLPYDSPEQLVRIWESHPAQQIENGAVSPGTFVDLQARSRTLGSFAIHGERDMLFSEDAETWESRVAAVSPELFELLDVGPIVGRGFTRREREAAGGTDAREAVIGYDVWRTRFGGDPGIAGRAIRLDHRWSYTIVGVMPPGFAFPSDAEVWTPLTYGPTVAAVERQFRYYGAIARLVSGRTLDDAQREVTQIAAELEVEYPASNAGWTIRLESLHDSIIGEARPTLLVMLGLAGCVLLIAAGNVATLAVARATARRRETAVRIALGAGRRRLLRQWMTEGALLAIAGGLAGLVVAWWSSRALLALAPSTVPRLEEVAFGWPIVLFAIVATCATAVVIGMSPAFRTRRTELEALTSRTGVAGGPSARSREWLLGAQVALTFVLLVASALLVRSFEQLRATDLGFRDGDVLAAEVRVPIGRFAVPRPWYLRTQFYDRLLEDLDALPGVRSVAGTSNVPFAGEIGIGSVWRTDAPGASGRKPPTSAADQWKAMLHVVTPNYFGTMGIPLLRGRVFEPEDRFTEAQLTDPEVARPAGVAVINETMAKRFFPGQEALGQTIFLFDDQTFAAHRTIVGVVRDVRLASVDSVPAPTVYLPFAQHPGRGLHVVMRTEVPPEQLVGAVTDRLRAFDQAVTVKAVRPLEAVVRTALARPRFAMMLAGSFGLLALLIAAVGIFGIVGYLVARRTQEIGIRVALGARPASVIRLVLGEGLRPVLIGAIAGALGAVVVARAMRAVLYEIAPLDAPSFVAAAALLLGAAMVAAAVPARRATRVDPLRAMRSE